MLPRPAIGSATARPSKQLLDTPRAVAVTGTDVCFNYSKCCYLYTSPKSPPPQNHSLKGAFSQSQQNEEIQLQPLTGPAYCYL